MLLTVASLLYTMTYVCVLVIDATHETDPLSERNKIEFPQINALLHCHVCEIRIETNLETDCDSF